jgi:hypothetical protein
MQTTLSEILGPFFDVGALMTGATESAVGRDWTQTVAGVASAALTGRGAITGEGYLGALSTMVGSGTSTAAALNTIGKQIDKMSGSLTSYNDAVASGDQGAISYAGLKLTDSVSTVLGTIGTIIAGVADALGSAGMISSAAAAPVVSLGLALSTAAGLFALTATNAVVNAVKAAAAELGNLLNDIESQLGTGSPNSGQPGAPGAGGSGPESGAGGAAMGKYPGDDALISPLVLDLTGSGINLTPLNTSSPYFDLANNGFARQTGGRCRHGVTLLRSGRPEHHEYYPAIRQRNGRWI